MKNDYLREFRRELTIYKFNWDEFLEKCSVYALGILTTVWGIILLQKNALFFGWLMTNIGIAIEVLIMMEFYKSFTKYKVPAKRIASP